MIALLLKATVLLTLGWVAALLLSRRSAALRHLVWTGVLAAVVMLALASPLLPSLRVSIGPLERAEARLTTVPVVNTISIPAQDQGPAAVTPNPQVTTRISRSPAEYLQLIWLAGGLAVIGWCVLGRLGLAWIRRRAQPLEEPSWQAELDAQRATCNVSRPIRLFLSNRVGSPATWGFIHPVIVLPTEAAGWTPERRSVVLAHELAHIARGDGLANLIGWVASALYWFHPLAWMAAKRLRAEAEKAADDYVLVRGVSPVAYAGHLLVVARGSRLIRLQGANAIGMARPETLEGRLIAVLDSNKNREAPRTLTRRATFGMLAGMVLPLAALTPTRSVEPKLPERPMGIAFPSQDTTRDIDQRFPAKPGGTLTLDFKTGAGVRIEGWDEPALHIGGHLGGRDWRGTLLMIGPDQNGRTIRTRQDREQGNISTSHYFDIKVPRQYNVRIESSGGGEDINVTPLMDIVFIMLIFFIVTSTFVKEPGVDVNRPKAETAEIRKLASILVAIDENNDIWINKKKIGLDEVRINVEGLKQENPKGTAVVQVDAKAQSRYLVEVVNQIREAGVASIAVSTEDL